MTETKRLVQKRLTLGDAAVDGLLNGLLAGAAMAILLAAAGLMSGESPLNVIARFDPSARTQPLTGALTHLAVSGVYGVLFGIVWRLIAHRDHQGAAALLAGTIFGLALFVIAETIILPGSHSALLELPAWQFAAAHLAYGLTLGWTVYRTEANSR